jgi:hypothetical protein
VQITKFSGWLSSSSKPKTLDYPIRVPGIEVYDPQTGKTIVSIGGKKEVGGRMIFATQDGFEMMGMGLGPTGNAYLTMRDPHSKTRLLEMGTGMMDNGYGAVMQVKNPDDQIIFKAGSSSRGHGTVMVADAQGENRRRFLSPSVSANTYAQSSRW